MRITAMVTIICSPLLLASCAYHRPPVVYTTPTGQVIAAGHDARTAADRALETSIRAELNRYGDLASANRDVQLYARNGVLTLSGPVRSERDRQLIETLARNTPGVTSVYDQLQVVYPPTGIYNRPVYSGSTPVYSSPAITSSGPVPRVEAGGVADEPLARRVADQLRTDLVPADWLSNVTVRVNNGAAYLQGTVATQQQREAIDAAVQRVRGLTAVYDQLDLR